jgi:hypothetical protein
LVYKKLLSEMNIEPNEENLQLHLELGANTLAIRSISAIRKHIQQILSANKKLNVYTSTALEKFIQELWKKLFFKAVDKGFLETVKYWFYSRTISAAQLKYFLGSYKFKLLKSK